MAELFRENNVEYENVNYFIEPLDEERLRALLAKMDAAPFAVLRTKEPIFKELSLSEKTPDEEIVRAIVAHPQLLERPIVEAGERAVLARPVERALELIRANENE